MSDIILLKEKQARILVALRSGQIPWHITTLAQECGSTYVHVCNFINVCEKLGIVKNEKHGKTKDIKLTEKGAQLADMVAGIYTALNQQPSLPPVPVEKKEAEKPQPKV